MKKSVVTKKPKTSKKSVSSKTSKKIKEIIKNIDNDKMRIDDVQELIDDGVLKKSLLIKESKIVDQDLYQKIADYEPLDTPFKEWKDLPPLQKNRTDLYFFGQPGSGKSCILASLFYYANKKGLIIDNQSNILGSQYRDQLLNGIKNGVLPRANPKEGVNYIPIDLINPNNKRLHPLNFIEMSGELFLEAYKKGINQKNLGANKYLQNNNRKLIFFVLDFNSHQKKQSVAQENMLQNVLTHLSDFKTLDKTDSIYLIISKSDSFPKDANRINFAKDFVEKQVKNFSSNLKRTQDLYDNNFKIILFPYTLGEVKLGGILTDFEMNSPKNLIDWICAYSFSEERNWWKKMLGIR